MPSEAIPYWLAFSDLDRDRPKNKEGGGMGPTITLPDNIPLDVIRREGERLGYVGDGLDDFTAALRGFDDEYVRVNSLRIAASVKADLAAARSRSR